MDRISAQGVIEDAERRSGLAAPAGGSWREGLDVLALDFAKADMLNENGRAIMHNMLATFLANRLSLDDYIRRNPAVLEQPVRKPVFILGMPRTGTTMTSYLMAEDPGRRSLLKWEVSNLVPPAAPGQLKTDPRCLAELAKDEEYVKADPEGAAKHFEAATGPTEDVHTMAQDFKSLMFASMTTTPVYSNWILMCDTTSAFEHRKRVYQVLQSTNPGRWTLKMPSDSLFIRTLFKVFPDARIIWTHRNPFVAVSSSYSMRVYGRSKLNKDPDLQHMRERFPLQLALHASRPLALSQERPQDFYHLYYDAMMRDPIAEMEKVYDWLGDEFTAETRRGMTNWLKQNPQGRFGAHRHNLEKFGLTRAEIAPFFSDYLKAHPIAASED